MAEFTVTRGDTPGLLRAAGLRSTHSRRKILDALIGADAPLAAEEIHSQTGCDLSTVYRSLHAFVEAGLLDALPGTNGEKRFEVRRAGGPRLMCLDCGKFLPLPEADLSQVGLAAARQGFDPQSITLAAHCAHVCEVD